MERVGVFRSRAIRWVGLFVALVLFVGSSQMPIVLGFLLIATSALYLNSFRVDRAAQLEAVGFAAFNVSMWWLIYGRFTPFPQIWVFGENDPQFVQTENILVVIAIVAVGAIVHAVFRPDHPEARGLAVLAWIGVEIWAIDRGDYDGLWGIAVMIVVPVAVLIVAVAGGVAMLSRKVRHSLANKEHRDHRASGLCSQRGSGAAPAA